MYHAHFAGLIFQPCIFLWEALCDKNSLDTLKIHQLQPLVASMMGSSSRFPAVITVLQQKMGHIARPCCVTNC